MGVALAGFGLLILILGAVLYFFSTPFEQCHHDNDAYDCDECLDEEAEDL